MFNHYNIFENCNTINKNYFKMYFRLSQEYILKSQIVLFRCDKIYSEKQYLDINIFISIYTLLFSISFYINFVNNRQHLIAACWENKRNKAKKIST